MRAAALAVFAVIGSASVSGEDATVRATAKPAKTEVAVGEIFEVTIEASGPAGTTWTFPQEATGDTIELRGVTNDGRPPTSPMAAPGPPSTGVDLAVQRYRAAVFTVADAQIPPITVKYRLPNGTAGETATAPVALRILSVLPKDPKQQTLADVRGPISLAIGRPFWIALALLLVILAAVAYWIRRRRRPAAAVTAVVPEVAPDVEVRAALDRLEAGGLLASGRFRTFYIALTEIAKRYLERRLMAPVLEMTSTETIAFLRDHARASELVSVMRDLVGAADQIKFACGEGQMDEARRHLSAVRDAVRILEARLAPPPSGIGTEKAA